jgi:hypothetical protein
MSPSRNANISIGRSNIDDVSIVLPTCSNSFRVPVNLFLYRKLIKEEWVNSVIRQIRKLSTIMRCRNYVSMQDTVHF